MALTRVSDDTSQELEFMVAVRVDCAVVAVQTTRSASGYSRERVASFGYSASRIGHYSSSTVPRVSTRSTGARDRYDVNSRSQLQLAEGTMSHIVKKCPDCNEDICRSYRVQNDYKTVKLECTACDKQFTVANTGGQRAALEEHFGRPIRTELVTSVNQLGRGDMLKRKTTVESDPDAAVDQYSICEIIDQANGEVVAIELIRDGERIDIERVRWKFDDIENADVQVLRFLPLDCLPRDKTLEEAQDFLEGRKVWECDQLMNSSMSFAFWCKVGIRTDEMEGNCEDGEEEEVEEEAENQRGSEDSEKFIPGKSSRGSRCSLS